MGLATSKGPWVPGHRCLMLEQPADTMEQVLMQLGLKDLSSLSKTCWKLNAAVERYIRQKGFHSLLKLKQFFAQNLDLLTEKEKRFYNRLCDTEELSTSYWWTVARLTHIFGKNSDKIKRVSCSDDNVWFPQRFTRKIPVEVDDALNRIVVKVSRVDWLEFKTTFTNLAAGSYQLLLRLKLLDEDFYFPHRDEDRILFVVQCPDENKQTIFETDQAWWTAIRNSKQESEVPKSELAVEFDTFSSHVGVGESRDWFNLGAYSSVNCPGKWVNIFLPPVKMAGGNIAFKFQDVQNPFLKKGIIFDFIQIKKVE